MEYLFNKTANAKGHRDCQIFIQKNQQLIQDVMMNNTPQLEVLYKNISSIDDVVREVIKTIENRDLVEYLKTTNKKKYSNTINYLLMRYFCSSKKDVRLCVTVDKKIDKYMHHISVEVDEKILKFIELQINFMRMKFNDFVEYLFENVEYFKSQKVVQFEKSKKNHILNIYVTREEVKDALFISENFYEVVEGSKIFLHYPNYEYFEKHVSFAYGNDLEETIKTFFRLKFLKYFLNKNYSLLDQEYDLTGGSFLMFSLGLRTSRDTDIYTIEGPEIKMVSPDLKFCNFDVIPYNKSSDFYDLWNEVTLNPNKYVIFYGLKANNLDQELKRRYSRFRDYKSRKALSDLMILLYRFNLKLDLEIDIGNRDISNVMFFRYKNLNREAIKKYILRNKKIIS